MEAWNAAAAAAAAAANVHRAIGDRRGDDDGRGVRETAPKTTTTTAVSMVADLGEAISRAAEAMSDGGGGVVCVMGSLNTVSRAQAWAVERGYRRRRNSMYP